MLPGPGTPPRRFTGAGTGPPCRRRRSDDAYTPGGAAGRRPDRATLVYARLARQAFGAGAFVVAGGVEASLRRLAHYDYWDDRVLPSLAADPAVDLVVYGQGERPVLEIARRLASGEDPCGLTDVAGTALVAARPLPGPPRGARWRRWRRSPASGAR